MAFPGLIELVDVSATRVEAEQALTPAASHSLLETPAGLLDACEADFAQLWHLGALWAVTRVRETPIGRVAQIVAMAGDYQPDLVEHIEAWSRSVGCTRIYFTGRPGWFKRRPDYRLRQVTLEKDL